MLYVTFSSLEELRSYILRTPILSAWVKLEFSVVFVSFPRYRKAYKNNIPSSVTRRFMWTPLRSAFLQMKFLYTTFQRIPHFQLLTHCRSTTLIINISILLPWNQKNP